jgi:hypothetical protein
MCYSKAQPIEADRSNALFAISVIQPESQLTLRDAEKNNVHNSLSLGRDNY